MQLTYYVSYNLFALNSTVWKFDQVPYSLVTVTASALFLAPFFDNPQHSPTMAEEVSQQWYLIIASLPFSSPQFKNCITKVIFFFFFQCKLHALSLWSWILPLHSCVIEKIVLIFFPFYSLWMATHSSTLAWRIPWMEELGGLQSTGHKESDTNERLHFHFTFLLNQFLDLQL